MTTESVRHGAETRGGTGVVEDDAFAALPPETLHHMALAVHTVTCDRLRRAGFRPGPVSDEEARVSSALRPFDELTPQEQEQNRAFARDIPRKLAAVGCRLVRAAPAPAPFRFGAAEVDLLSQLEHDRYVQAKGAAGWRYGTVIDARHKLHSALVAWDELSEEQRERDRVLVRAIPEIVAIAGYAVARQEGARP